VRPIAVVVALLALGACVGPARTFAKYESKAVHTAKDTRSAVQTARLAARAAAGRKAFGPYLSVTISEAEDDASSIQQTFDSIQPPDAEADHVRDELDGLLDDVVSTLGDLRIAARRGQLDRLADIAQPLDEQSNKLEHFQKDHSS